MGHKPTPSATLCAVVAALLEGCAGGVFEPPAPGYREAQQACAATMYGVRAGHESPKWNVYDTCMKARGYGPDQ